MLQDIRRHKKLLRFFGQVLRSFGLIIDTSSFSRPTAFGSLLDVAEHVFVHHKDDGCQVKDCILQEIKHDDWVEK